jgi:hypothetical protein
LDQSKPRKIFSKIEDDCRKNETLDENDLVNFIHSDETVCCIDYFTEDEDDENEKESENQIISMTRGINGLSNAINYLLLSKNSLTSQSELLLLENLKEKLIVN